MMASATFPDDHRQYQPYQPWYQRPLYHPWSVHPELLLPPPPWFCEKSIQPRPNHSCGTKTRHECHCLLGAGPSAASAGPSTE